MMLRRRQRSSTFLCFVAAALLIANAICLTSPAIGVDSPASQPSEVHNDSVIRAARSFADGGGYRKDWAGGSGSPVEVKHKGAIVLKKDAGGTYCNGLTFATAIKVLSDAGHLDDKTSDAVRAFQRTWYGTTPATAEKQCAQALGELGVGREVTSDQAMPGDFVQFWRSGSGGHSAIFLGWIDQDGQRIGLRYRSSQNSTNGIGDFSEKFEGHGGKVIATRAYFGRID